MVLRNEKIKTTDMNLELIEPHGVTIDDIAHQLDEDRDLAHRLGKPGAAIHATMGKAKLYGFISSQAEIPNPRLDPEPKKYTDLEIARRLAFLISSGIDKANALSEIKKNQPLPS